MTLAIDRFAVSRDIEEEARDRAQHLAKDDALLNGYLAQSVAKFLEAPRWSGAARRRLAMDLRTIQIVHERPHVVEQARRAAVLARYER